MKDIKFKLTTDTIVNVWGITLFRIEAIVDIKERGVKKGERGGYVESTHLSNGNARVFGNAWVSGNAQVSGNARVFGDAQVFGNARVSGNAWVSGNAQVSGNARVFGDAQVFGNARVSGNAQVFGDAWVYGNARVFGDAQVFGNARVSLKKAYTKGNFLSSSNRPIVPVIIDQSKEDGFDKDYNYKNLLVTGDYEINDIEPKEAEKPATIEIGGKTYEVSDDLTKALKDLKELK